MAPNGSSFAPLTSHREHSFNSMGVSPNSSVGSFDEAMKHIGPGYALHGGAPRGPYHHQQDTGAQGMRGMGYQCCAVVPRGLEPSPVVEPGRTSRGHDWAHHRQMPVGYGNAYEGTDDFAHQYAGMGTVSESRSASRVSDEPYAYCFDRGNGEYTRLIPADMLPELESIPRRQRGAEGMAVLPVPKGRAPPPCTFYFKTRGTQVQHQQLPADPIQVRASRSSHIDTIVKSAPPPAGPRRNKVYCDKWVHEGTCAFTQQGCRFKHEMPLDRATQAALGLFHGLPSWWKKQQAELQRQREPVSPTASERGESESPAGCGTGMRMDGQRRDEGRGVGVGRRQPSPCVFGAIGTPTGRSGGRPRSGLAASRHNQGSRGAL